jgi:orotidine-5'-phosphate decarboxylase
VEDFNDNLIHRLKELSEKHKFLIFEDRKFADIGEATNGDLSTSATNHVSVGR